MVYSMRTTPDPDTTVDVDHPYSLVRTVDGRLGWVSGVVPYGGDGKVITERDAAIDRALTLLAERIADAGATLDDVVKVTAYLTDLDWRDSLNNAFAARFRPPLPARTAVEVSRLPRGSGIELDAVVQVAAPG